MSMSLGQALNGRSFVEFPAFDLWEEKPRKLGPNAMRNLIGGYNSDDDVHHESSMVPVGMSLLDAYGSDSDLDARVSEEEHSEDEVDWGHSDDDSAIA